MDLSSQTLGLLIENGHLAQRRFTYLEISMGGTESNSSNKIYNSKFSSLLKDKFGNWEIFFPRNEDGTYMIDHNSRVKVHILNDKDQWVDRIPSWATFTY